MVLGAVLASGVAAGNNGRFVSRIDHQQEDEEEGKVFMASSGVLANRFFILIIVVQAIPFVFYLQGC